MTAINRGGGNLRLGPTQGDAAYAGAVKIWPPLPAYLNHSIGTVTAPDHPNLTPVPPIEYTFSLRRVDPMAFQTVVLHRVTPSDQSFQFYFQNGGFVFLGATDGATPVYGNVMLPAEVAVLGDIANKDTLFRCRIDPRPANAGYDIQGFASIDKGVTWVPGVRRAFAMLGPFWNTTDALRTSPGGMQTYWMQALNVARAHLVFPGVPGNALSVPSVIPTDSPGDLEVVARVSMDWLKTSPEVAIYPTIMYMTNAFYFRRNISFGGRYMQFVPYSPDGSVITLTLAIPAAWTTNQMVWIRGRKIGTTVSLDWAPDSPIEPKTWTSMGGTVVAPASGVRGHANPMIIGSDRLTTGVADDRYWNGRIARTIVRVGGTTVFDMSEINGGGKPTPVTSFVANSGQTVTVAQTAGNQIVQPAPDELTWRFDASKHERGRDWTDSQGRVWTLNTLGAVIHPT